MKNIGLIILLVLVISLSGCSIQLTSELKEKIKERDEEIARLEKKIGEIKNIDADIADLSKRLGKTRAIWQSYKIKYKKEIEQLTKRD